MVLGYFKKQPVCFMLFFHSYSTFLGQPGIYIEDLYVDEAFRRRGFGSALLRYIAKLATERRCGRLEWSVLDWNEPAINFYKKLGAVPMREWTVFRMTGEKLKNSPTRAFRARLRRIAALFQWLASGIRILISVPFPAAVSSVRVPPILRIRSRIPASP